MSDSSGPPPIADSPSPDVVLERSFFWGMLWAMALYGMFVFMYAYSTHLFWISPSASRRSKQLYIIIGGLLFAFLTIATFVNAVFLELMWIDHRDAPGGPLGYLAANETVWWQVFGSAAGQVTNFIADGLLIYRCWIICNSRWNAIVLPFIVYLASIAMAMLNLIQSALPDSSFFHGKTVNYGVVWIALTVSLNIMVTGMILFRILRIRGNLRARFLGNAGSSAIYTGVAAMLIESALPFSALGLITAVTYGKNLDIAPAFVFIWGPFTAIAPQFIIFRVASGRAWSRHTASTIYSETNISSKDYPSQSVSVQMTTMTRTDEESHNFKGKSVGSL
ncbi:hypothetical protein B0H19DRAFT_1069108 [Mycena capillaripes]|nr:hypothetical protein B0H19DRAFT_1069108 [Mycena capillaripes]